MDPIIGAAIVTLIQVVTELAKQSGMTSEQVNQHFLESWSKVQDRPANELPDVE
jgi:hypothetical protein